VPSSRSARKRSQAGAKRVREAIGNLSTRPGQSVSHCSELAPPAVAVVGQLDHLEALEGLHDRVRHLLPRHLPVVHALGALPGPPRW
jgi:hypothetical protein